MNLYEKASLIITPNAYKAGKIYAAKPTSGDGDLTFARAGLGSRRKASLTIESLGNDVPPLHYPLDGGCPAWAMLPQRTNLFLNPEAAVTQNITVVIGQVYTVTTFGTVTATCSGAGAGVASNNGSFTFTASTTTLTVTISGLSGQAYVNCGLGPVTWVSPVMSGASATTRIAGASNTNLTASGILLNTEGCLYAEYNPVGFGVEGGRIIALSEVSISNRIFLAYNINNTISVFIRNTSGIIWSPTSVATQINGWNKIALNFISGSMQVWLNGVQVLTAANAISFPQPINLFHLGTSEVSNVATNSVLIRSALIFQSKLTNAEIQALTTL